MTLNAEAEQSRHRAGVFKQQNKSHKTGRHRSKGALEIINKGRVQKIGPKKLHREVSGEARRNRAIQLRKQKREEYLKLVRNQNSPPFIIAVVPLSNNISYFETLNKLKSCDPDGVVTYSESGYPVVRIPRFKQRFMFVPADMNRAYYVLNATKIADAVLLLASVDGLDENADHILSCMAAQGMPSTLLSIADIETVPKKKQQDTKEKLLKSVTSVISTAKTINLDSFSDMMSFFRVISTKKPDLNIQRDRRPYIVAESLQYEKSENDGPGMMKVAGFVRGQTLSVNDLVHVFGWKDFKLRKIEILSDPHKSDSANLTVIQTQFADITKQPSLQSENIPDPMDAEQTWPTEEELQEAAAADTKNRKRLMKKVPGGFSEYQAAWIPDCDAEEVSDVSDLEEQDEEGDCEMSDDDNDERKRSRHVSFAMDADDARSQVSTTTSEIALDPEKYDKTVNEDEEKLMLQKIKEARSEKMFPDEVDTPTDVPARVRFQKYRGLKSQRTSPWDPKENLPSDYARIFQFASFKRTEKKIRKETEEKAGIAPGTYINLYLEDVTQEEFERLDRGVPTLIIGMLPHENKMSVLNIMLKRPTVLESDEPIKSKEELIFQVGYRRFKCCPIFSQLGTGTVHKYERFFQPDETVVATVYAPIQFPPCSVLAFKEHEDGSVELVASGRVISVNPDRVVVKRTILSGHPYKVNKKSAVIRFMFYNKEDIEWFKPIELQTKYGRRGHIKEPLGTHGHMKCFFDKPMKSQDTILLNLYKRMFPRWTYTMINTALYGA